MQDAIFNFISYAQEAWSLNIFKDDKSSISALSQNLFHWYYIEITIIGILLLVSLICSIELLNSKKKKIKFFYIKK